MSPATSYLASLKCSLRDRTNDGEMEISPTHESYNAMEVFWYAADPDRVEILKESQY